MKRYRLIIPIFASFSVEVEAKNKDDAINKYLSGDINPYVPTLCHRCSSKDIKLGDIDGSADVEAEEIK